MDKEQLHAHVLFVESTIYYNIRLFDLRHGFSASLLIMSVSCAHLPSGFILMLLSSRKSSAMQLVSQFAFIDKQKQ